jgi:hypothetical protein
MFHSKQDIQVTSGRNGGNVSADLLAAVATGPVSDQPGDLVALVGYLEPAGSGMYRRLYRDPPPELFIELRPEDIVYGSSSAGNGGPMAEQSLIWVRRDADVVWHESKRASSFATRTPVPTIKWPRP